MKIKVAVIFTGITAIIFLSLGLALGMLITSTVNYVFYLWSHYYPILGAILFVIMGFELFRLFFERDDKQESEQEKELCEVLFSDERLCKFDGDYYAVSKEGVRLLDSIAIKIRKQVREEFALQK